MITFGCVEVEVDVGDLAEDAGARGGGIAEAVVAAIDSLGLVASNIDTGCVGDILDDGSIEFAPNTVGDEETRVHSINDGEIRVRVIQRGTIDRGSIHDVLDADSPAAIISCV